MKQIIYNSFPRCGNVYAGTVSHAVLDRMYATVHIPEIFGVQNLDIVSIFRKPEDCISSLINKQGNGARISDLDYSVEQSCKEYKEYMVGATKNYDRTYIVEFDDFTTNTVKHLIQISQQFNIVVHEDYSQRFDSLDLTGTLWVDELDGHLPRAKSDDRLRIESYVKSLDIVQDLNREYQSFIDIYGKTI